MSPLGALARLARGVVDLKRVRDARGPRSVAERGFARSWSRLAAGTPVAEVCRAEAAAAVAALRLGALDAAALLAHGLDAAEAEAALGRAFDDAAAELPAALAAELRGGLADAVAHAARAGRPSAEAAPEPPFVAALVAQPRAGATRPGRGRLVLEPAESHADHAYAVAVVGALAAPAFGAAPERPFLTGLAHHLTNATLPDPGHAGDVLLGEPLVGRLRDAALSRALAGLPDELGPRVRGALDATRPERFDAPDARAFHAADVLDRVLEMAWHARAARFRLADALGSGPDGLDICHEGFYQAFQLDVLRRAGIWDARTQAELAGSGPAGGDGAPDFAPAR